MYLILTIENINNLLSVKREIKNHHNSKVFAKLFSSIRLK